MRDWLYAWNSVWAFPDKASRSLSHPQSGSYWLPTRSATCKDDKKVDSQQWLQQNQCQVLSLAQCMWVRFSSFIACYCLSRSWTTVHAHYAEMWSFWLQIQRSVSADMIFIRVGYILNFDDAHPPVPLFGHQIRVLIEMRNIFSKFPI